MATWLERIDAALRHEDPWRKQARRAVQQYRSAHGNQFNILWPNTVLKHSAVFGRTPTPVVRKRFGNSPVANKISLALERVLEYQMDLQPWKAIMDDVVLDWLLPGRGVGRVRYTPEYGEREDEVYADDEGKFWAIGNSLIVDPEQLRERDGELFYVRNEVLGERADIEHVPWDQFVHDPQERWCDVGWVAFHHRMTPREAKNWFGPEFKSAKLASIQEGQERDDSGAEDNRGEYNRTEPRFSIWEIWDRDATEVLFVSGGDKREKVLLKVPDPYGLSGFFPTPEPLRSVITPGTLLPTPEYFLYETQATELNIVTQQLKRILRQVRPKGLYDASLPPSFRDMARVDESVLHPVENMAAMMDQMQNGGVIYWWEHEKFAQTAAVLSEYRAQLLGSIYEITGLSDILRGSSDPRETATAQGIKQHFGGLRLRPLQEHLQQYIVSLLEMQTELVAEKFDLLTIGIISQMELPLETRFLLRSDVARQYQIDIETDSTLALDDNVQKQQRAEFLGMFAQVLGQAAQAQQVGLLDQAAVGEIVSFALQPYRVSRELEDTLARIGQAPDQQQDQPTLGDQAKMLQAQTKAQELQLKMAELQQKGVLGSSKLQLDAYKAREDVRLEEEKIMIDALKAAT